MTDPGPMFTRAEAGRVLDRVFASREAGIGRDAFADAVRELGVTDTELDLAVGQVARERQEATARREADRRRRLAYGERIAMGVAALAALACLNAITGEAWWAHWAAFGWALWAVLDGWRVFTTSRRVPE
jgi:hypothetical protein